MVSSAGYCDATVAGLDIREYYIVQMSAQMPKIILLDLAGHSSSIIVTTPSDFHNLILKAMRFF